MIYFIVNDAYRFCSLWPGGEVRRKMQRIEPKPPTDKPVVIWTGIDPAEKKLFMSSIDYAWDIPPIDKEYLSTGLPPELLTLINLAGLVVMSRIEAVTPDQKIIEMPQHEDFIETYYANSAAKNWWIQGLKQLLEIHDKKAYKHRNDFVKNALILCDLSMLARGWSENHGEAIYELVETARQNRCQELEKLFAPIT